MKINRLQFDSCLNRPRIWSSRISFTRRIDRGFRDIPVETGRSIRARVDRPKMASPIEEFPMAGTLRNVMIW